MVVRLSKDTYGCARDDSCRSHKAGEFAMMSRRKQARPQHIDNVKELALLLENGTQSSSDTDEGDEHVCGKCRAEFKELVTFLQHKQRCTSKRPVLLPSDECPPLSVADLTDDTDTKLLPLCSNGDLLTLVPRKSTYGESEGDIPDDRDEMLQPSHLPQNHLIQQQIVSEIIKDGAPHLVALQSALCTLQQQQIVQLQVIQELQNQLLGASDSPLSVSSIPPLIGTVALTPPQSSDANPGAQAPSSSVPSAPTPSRTITNTANLPIASTSEKIGQSSANTSSLRVSEPNTLELLERHTEQALQNTMAGSSFLLNGISGSNSEIVKFRKKTGTSKSEEPSIRHKCRFCGKVFGSDSSLQIHIRSHTGERPFKCNVCGNRFTTRGNLKVHFQRHKSKYPHIIMNSMPIPEYLDNLHPPLESPSDTPNHLLPSPHGNSPAFSLDQDRVRDVLHQDGERIEAISPPNISNSSDATEISAEDSMPPEDGEKGEMKIDPEDPENQKQGLSPLTDHHSDISEKDFDTDNEQHQTSSFVISTSSPTFSSFFQTTSYAPGVTVPLCFAPVSGSATKLTTTDSALDPAFYQNLLPRPGTNDNSWESLMEITNPSETAKLQQLVDNIEHKLIDPNQCVICHRVLSCKSALQMHYRTHTGERPFKCKICGRAFTTKGNLKTHMGVHRVKPPVRVLHQCPICHKQFSNSLILQQHIRMHTGETTDLSIQSKLLGADVKSLSVLPPSFPRLPLPDIPQHLTSTASKSLSHSPSISAPTTETVIRTMTSLPSNTTRTESATQLLNNPERDKPITVMAPSTSSPSPLLTPSSYTASLVALENQVKSITTNIPHPLPFSPFGMGMSVNYLRHDTSFHGRQPSGLDKSPSSAYSPASAPSRPGSETSADGRSTPGSAVKSESPPSVITAVRHEGESALDLTPKTTCSASPSLSDTMSKGLPPPLIGLPFAASPGRLNTTCKLCFKTFACNSALEIHYRSHTKERPFKCNLCDRGFSTRGNMKQHMLTHRIRDLPSQLFTATTSSNSLDVPTSTSPIESATKPIEVTSPEQISSQPQITQSQQSQITQSQQSQTMQSQQSQITQSQQSQITQSQQSQITQSQQSQITPSPQSQKRPIIDDIPQPKRSPSVPKHLCRTCNKPFSSGSALQIHMRTHTGDKPFKCTVCGRPFTTKGNLKVHMGTHMWNSPTSRRGRRMSLELPLSPVRAGEFPTRPEIFFPYLPPGYLNGINTPKMNEISVIQTAGLSNGTMTGPVVNPSGRHNQQDGSKPEEELENRKSPAHGNQTSPTFPTLSPASPITTERPAAWGWKIACNICNKICCSSLELESHIKTHHYTESSHGPTSSTKELVGQSQ